MSDDIGAVPLLWSEQELWQCYSEKVCCVWAGGLVQNGTWAS